MKIVEFKETSKIKYLLTFCYLIFRLLTFVTLLHLSAYNSPQNTSKTMISIRERSWSAASSSNRVVSIDRVVGPVPSRCVASRRVASRRVVYAAAGVRCRFVALSAAFVKLHATAPSDLSFSPRNCCDDRIPFLIGSMATV